MVSMHTCFFEKLQGLSESYLPFLMHVMQKEALPNEHTLFRIF